MAARSTGEYIAISRRLAMLNIKETRDGSRLTLDLTGRLDTKTAPDLESIIEKGLDGVESLIILMENLDYISSAGLRVLLSARKKMKNKEFIIEKPNESIMGIFEMTGFADILDIR
jgi:anti-sigma B factor antagonist